jgi:hypothetical protein
LQAVVVVDRAALQTVKVAVVVADCYRVLLYHY